MPPAPRPAGEGSRGWRRGLRARGCRARPQVRCAAGGVGGSAAAAAAAGGAGASPGPLPLVAPRTRWWGSWWRRRAQRRRAPCLCWRLPCRARRDGGGQAAAWPRLPLANAAHERRQRSCRALRGHILGDHGCGPSPRRTSRAMPGAPRARRAPWAARPPPRRCSAPPRRAPPPPAPPPAAAAPAAGARAPRAPRPAPGPPAPQRQACVRFRSGAGPRGRSAQARAPGDGGAAARGAPCTAALRSHPTQRSPPAHLLYGLGQLLRALGPRCARRPCAAAAPALLGRLQQRQPAPHQRHASPDGRQPRLGRLRLLLLLPGDGRGGGAGGQRAAGLRQLCGRAAAALAVSRRQEGAPQAPGAACARERSAADRRRRQPRTAPHLWRTAAPGGAAAAAPAATRPPGRPPTPGRRPAAAPGPASGFAGAGSGQRGEALPAGSAQRRRRPHLPLGDVAAQGARQRHPARL
jgi:hypothetical protein